MNNYRKCRKTKYRLRDNRGMSMLEVIIAVCIFSVAAAVLLQGFVTSGRINKKSGLYLEAMSTAQNVMEEIKSKSFEEVSLAFNYPVNKLGEARLQFLNSQISGGTLEIYEALPSTNPVSGKTEYGRVAQYKQEFNGDMSKVTASVISEDGGLTYEFNPRSSGTNASKYYFVIKNVRNDNETFDVLAEFDGSESSGYKSAKNAVNANKKNDYLAPNIAVLDTKTNAIFELKRSDIKKYLEDIAVKYYSKVHGDWESSNPNLDEAIQEAQEAGNQEQVSQLQAQKAAYQSKEPQEIDWEELRKQTTMKMELKIQKESTGAVRVEAKTTFDASKYKREGGSEYESMSRACPCGGTGNAVDNHFCKIDNEEVIATFSGGDNEMNALFILYDPNYASTSQSNPLDEIILDNRVNQEILFYVVKQKNIYDGTPTSLQEINYKMKLEIQDMPVNYKKSQPNWYTNATMFRSITKLRTNLNINIAENSGRMSINQLSPLTYTGVHTTPAYTKKRTRNVAETILDMKGLEAKEAEDRIYTAKVSVYKAGAAADGFPDDQLVVSLDGAKEK